MNHNNHNGAGNFPLNPVDKFEEAFMNCLTSLTKEDTLTNLDREEIKLDAELGFQNVIDCARAMEGYFLKKRLEIAAQKPELIVKDDSSELRLELVRKDELLKRNFEKVSNWQSILADLQSANSGAAKPNVPGQTGTSSANQPSIQPGSQGPLTPVGRPTTPGSAGRPQTPVGSSGVNIQQLPSARMQKSGASSSYDDIKSSASVEILSEEDGSLCDPSTPSTPFDQKTPMTALTPDSTRDWTSTPVGTPKSDIIREFPSQPFVNKSLAVSQAIDQKNMKCLCTSKCKHNKCKCRKAKRKCTEKCHRGEQCYN